MLRIRVGTALLGILGLVAACATSAPPPGTPTIERWTRPPVGSAWMIAYKNSGSYGSDQGRSTIRFIGEQEFQGKKYLGYSVDETDLTYYDPSGRLVGRTVKSAVRETNDPGFQAFAWPLHVGRSWMHTFRFTDHATGQSFDNVQFWSAVEAYEDVAIPAGSFKTFRITHDNRSVRFTNWWSPELGVLLKSKSERKSTYHAGAGVRETEVVSLDLKK